MIGEGMAYGGLPFRALVVTYQMLAIFTLHEMINVRDTVSTFIPLPFTTQFI